MPTDDLSDSLQAGLRGAKMTWTFYAYGRTVHAFTLMENPLWNGDKSVVSSRHVPSGTLPSPVYGTVQNKGRHALPECWGQSIGCSPKECARPGVGNPPPHSRFGVHCNGCRPTNTVYRNRHESETGQIWGPCQYACAWAL